MKSNIVAIGVYGFVQMSEELEKRVLGSALAFHKSWWKDVLFFNRDGYIYTVENAKPERQLGSFSKLLSHTIFNPTIWFEYSYLKVRTYEHSELQAAVRRSVEKDDDILTQYYRRDVLLKLLSTSNDFDSIVAILVRCFEGNGND